MAGEPTAGTQGNTLDNKYDVRRTDGRDAPGGDREGAEYFVLDLTHDPLAAFALRAYADVCRAADPRLAAALYATVNRTAHGGTHATLAPPGGPGTAGSWGVGALRSWECHFYPDKNGCECAAGGFREEDCRTCYYRPPVGEKRKD